MKSYKCKKCKFSHGSRKVIRTHMKEVHKIKCYRDDMTLYQKHNTHSDYTSNVSQGYFGIEVQ